MKKIIKPRFLWLVLSLVLVFSFSGSGWSFDENEPCTVMRPDRETRLKWFKAFEDAPRAYIDKDLNFSIPLTGSLSLLSHLNYVPSQRNQGSCGNCWAWAGTGVMGIALDVEESVFDRLSVQYINSCETTAIGKVCCAGGWLSDVADFYSTTSYEQAIPWSNSNAHWQDGDASCDTSCASISTTPNYPINSINEVSIDTHGVSQATAIANIKNILHQNRAVWFAFFMPTEADGNNFRNFWWNQSENVTWNPDFSCGHTWSNGFGHAVLCVGYNDDDPNNSYWIIVNSWGTAGGGRPNGIFRLDMDMNYECTFYDSGWYYSMYWQTLDIEYNITGDICECDLNHDGKCDMQDWLLFGEDWGRTDCPIPAMATPQKPVAPNNSPTGDPDQTIEEAGVSHRVIKVENALPDGNQPGIKGQKVKPKRRAPKSIPQEKNPAPSAVHTPLWEGLEKLGQADRENAKLQIEVSEDLAPSVLEDCEAVEGLWNNGKFDQAIEALKSLEAEGIAAAVGLSWKTPKPMAEPEWWDDDVRIGTRTVIYQKVLDADAQTGNLFTVLKYYEDPYYCFSVNISTDDGQTWQETYTGRWTQWIVDVDVAVMGNHLYLAYVSEVYPSQARLRRFYTSNGASDTTYNYKTVFDTGHDISEIALTSNVDSVLSGTFLPRIYYAAISNYYLYFYWGYDDGITWTLSPTGINYALYGLDACWNELFDNYFMYVSFVGLIIGAGEQDATPLCVARWTGGTWDVHQFDDQPPLDTNTAIAVYDDRVMVVFENNYTYDSGVKYWVSYDAGDYWRYGNIAVPASAGNYFAGPDVAGRNGGGFAVVYAEEAGSFDPCWYMHRDYGTGPGTAPWSTPEQFNELDVLSLEDLAAEWVPPLPGSTYAYGSIYAANDQYAYFDRSDGGEADICECDLNHDGKCDMQDWLLFGEDWGRTDCPTP